MKTKKEILKWWEKLGEGKDQRYPETRKIIQERDIPLNDYNDFYKKIDNHLTITQSQEGTGDKQRHTLKIMSLRWKYPLTLYFYNLECYRIVGF